MHKKVRAISPLVAALLLIMIGIAGAVLIYLWLTGFASKGASIPAHLKAEIKIEGGYMYAARPPNITLFARNIGTAGIDFNAFNLTIYIYDSSTGELVATNTSVPKNAVVELGTRDGIWEPGELVNITVLLSNITDILPGHYYDVKLVVMGIEYYVSGIKARQG